MSKTDEWLEKHGIEKKRITTIERLVLPTSKRHVGVAPSFLLDNYRDYVRIEARYPVDIGSTPKDAIQKMRKRLQEMDAYLKWVLQGAKEQ